MVIGWKHVAGVVVAGALVAFFTVWAGVIGVGASSGHWKVTDWFLHWAMRSSVRTAALGTTVPTFTQSMLPMAAGHFEAGCAICHGSPARPRPDSVRHMLPAPPDLKDKIGTWNDAELFQIVQHGVRLTGMPAWPVQTRADEAWAMVAFLRRYPEMDASAYRALTGLAGTPSTGMDRTVVACNGCHAPGRLDAQSLIPRLAGQSETYLEQTLAAYAGKTRPSGIMAVAIQGLTEPELKALARHFANQAPAIAREPSSNELTRRGEMLAMKGNPERRIPACLSCHDKPAANPAYPRLSGQTEAYLAGQLRLFSGKIRGGGPFKDVMTRAAANLEDDDITALATYFSGRQTEDEGPVSSPQ